MPLTHTNCVFSFKEKLVVPPSELKLHHHFQILPKSRSTPEWEIPTKTITAGKGRRALAAGRCV